MVYETIEYRKKGNVGLINFMKDLKDQDGISRLAYEISDVSSTIASEEETWVVVLNGIGKNSPLMERDPIVETHGIEDIEDFMSLSVSEPIASMEQPVIAGVDGDAVGLGLEIALACDLRIASEESRFGLPILGKGLIPWNGGTQRLARLVGKGKALEMILTGSTIEAREAYRIGLVSKVVSSKELDKTVMSIAKEMAGRGPVALRYTKEAINTGMDLTLEQGLHLEADLYMLIHTSRDRTEGIRAFQEKREPKFENR